MVNAQIGMVTAMMSNSPPGATAKDNAIARQMLEDARPRSECSFLEIRLRIGSGCGQLEFQPHKSQPIKWRWRLTCSRQAIKDLPFGRTNPPLIKLPKGPRWARSRPGSWCGDVYVRARVCVSSRSFFLRAVCPCVLLDRE